MSEKSYEEMVSEAKGRIREITPREAITLREQDGAVVYLDVREPQEWNLFRIPGAVHVPLSRVAQITPEQIACDRQVILYCSRGNRSALATDTMQQMGFTNVVSMAEGIMGWVNAGGAVEE
ncbi:MAG TPA: rhodanese-like domain-containing protein [Gemmatimonadaceae bacterium]|nr:rhodanese-like domain-containing protein [Gemmatimonadaceae bacterium]